MSWGKGLIIVLGLMQLSHVAHARDIESFTDSQGTLHITNTGPKQQGSPANPPSPAAPLRPSSFPRKAPIALPAREPAPEAQAPVPKPEAAPAGPVPVDSQPGSRVTHPEGSGGVMPLADRTGKKAGPGLVKPLSGASAPTMVAQQDHRGVVHIFTRASAESMSDRDSPVNFLGRVSPALQSCIIEVAELYRLPIPLILALIRKESNFAHQAVSPKGAMGLMQLMPGTAASLGVRDPFDVRENILAGCRYFRQLMDYFQGNVPLALAGYNRVISTGCQVPAIKETQEFATQVMGLYYLLEKHVSGLSRLGWFYTLQFMDRDHRH